MESATDHVARLISGVDPTTPSPQWLQRRLTLAGMRPISLAVDVTNHVMLDLGQPFEEKKKKLERYNGRNYRVKLTK